MWSFTTFKKEREKLYDSGRKPRKWMIVCKWVGNSDDPKKEKGGKRRRRFANNLCPYQTRIKAQIKCEKREIK